LRNTVVLSLTYGGQVFTVTTYRISKAPWAPLTTALAFPRSVLRVFALRSRGITLCWLKPILEHATHCCIDIAARVKDAAMKCRCIGASVPYRDYSSFFYTLPWGCVFGVFDVALVELEAPKRASSRHACCTFCSQAATPAVRVIHPSK
jgi:hypothetical protein